MKQLMKWDSWTKILSTFLNVCPETMANRNYLESKISCGIPNMDIIDDTDVDDRVTGRRFKRVVGGIPSKPVRWRHTHTGLSVRISVLLASPTGDSLMSDSDSVASCCGGERKDWLWGCLHWRMLGTHRCPLCQVVFGWKWWWSVSTLPNNYY